MNELVGFENNYMCTAENFGPDNPDAFAYVSIDGYPADEDEPGEVVCQVWMTRHKDVIIAWVNNGYRNNQAVLELIEDSKRQLEELWAQAHS